MSGKTKDLLKNIHSFKFDPSMSKADRLVEFLDWGARNHPGQFCPYNFAVKAINGYSRTPMINSREVEALRSSFNRVNKKLQERYGRSLFQVPGVGVRATVDVADATQNVMTKKSSRLNAARNAYVQTAQLLDPSKIPDTPELRPWKQWLKTSVKDVLKTISSPDFEQRLLAPHDDDKK